ncbi:MAG: hypothetical protein ISS47_08555 [Candidatus Omnitrophica bacterium]|nr:hypothetical protein [Candidatus Omnitrophota bacterium]
MEDKKAKLVIIKLSILPILILFYSGCATPCIVVNVDNIKYTDGKVTVPFDVYEGQDDVY